MTLGQTIQDHRLRTGMTLSELADRACMSKGYLSQIESGSVASPSAAMVYNLARVFGVTVEALMSDTAPIAPVRKKYSFLLTDEEAQAVMRLLSDGERI